MATAVFTPEQQQAILRMMTPCPSYTNRSSCTYYCACPTCHAEKTAKRKAEAETECPSAPVEETIDGVVWRKVPNVPTISITQCGQIRRNATNFLYRVRNLGRGRPGWVEVPIKNQRLFLHRLINEAFYPERDRDDADTLKMIAEKLAENPNWGRPAAVIKKRKGDFTSQDEEKKEKEI